MPDYIMCMELARTNQAQKMPLVYREVQIVVRDKVGGVAVMVGR
jgi:hypothetical protein